MTGGTADTKVDRMSRAALERELLELRSVTREIGRLQRHIDSLERGVDRRVAAESAARQHAEREANRFHALLLAERIRKIPERNR